MLFKNYLKLSITAALLLLFTCNRYIWVSNLDYLESIYGIKEKQIINIDTVQTKYEKMYKVKYRWTLEKE